MQKITVPGLMISAPHKSSGKTLLSLGLARAFVLKGYEVQMFKKGPDYIDPMWHELATGRKSFNLDPYLFGVNNCLKSYGENTAVADLAVVEGNHGLHDGMDLLGKDSSASVGRTLGIPVVLIVDGSGMNRSVGALVLGQMKMDENIKIRGVVLNKIRSTRQEAKQIGVIEHYCGIPVLGVLPVNHETIIEERHLGLITSREVSEPEKVVHHLASLVQGHVNLDQVLSIAKQAESIEFESPEVSQTINEQVVVAIAMDKAFCFYYPENIEALKRAGAKVVYFSPLKDKKVPKANGIYIGGGFPESFLLELESNEALKTDLREKIAAGLPVYAECGGLMYLSRSITRNGVTRKMVGAVLADTEFQEKPFGYGYSEISATREAGWLKLSSPVKGHEFHYSRLVNLDASLKFAFKVERGFGIDGVSDGVVVNNTIGTYFHLHARAFPTWAENFVRIMLDFRNQ
ncbi:MAG: hydrogenobyrinic acid a,c-diamide synthase (glutamine-hydrolyzing) [Deltaproteobacteria bacterium]|nr:hydrogenobyrinic acid a,c-diamide synthase (glutamine-hydrolyzing) [Deltaproteobacteria bacterium]